MNKFVTFTAISSAILFSAAAWAGSTCTTIQDGVLETTEIPPQVIEPGFDDWGYNYQARMFNGGYCDVYRNAAWCQPYADVDLIMKWNAAWLDNKDCSGDGKLDRHFGFTSYIGSGAWITNHQSGKVEVNGRMRKWTYFVKIVAAPETAYTADNEEDLLFWYTEGGTEIGPVIWGSFAVVQEVINDPSDGSHGKQYGSPNGPGFGKY